VRGLTCAHWFGADWVALDYGFLVRGFGEFGVEANGGAHGRGLRCSVRRFADRAGMALDPRVGAVTPSRCGREDRWRALPARPSADALSLIRPTAFSSFGVHD
jgi:hypothetical protein